MTNIKQEIEKILDKQYIDGKCICGFTFYGQNITINKSIATEIISLLKKKELYAKCKEPKDWENEPETIRVECDCMHGDKNDVMWLKKLDLGEDNE